MILDDESHATVSARPAHKPREFSDSFVPASSPLKLAIFEIEGTLRTSKGPWPSTPEEVWILPGVADKIAQLRRDGYAIVVLSNTSPNLGYKDTNDVMVETFAGLMKRNPEGLVDYYDFSSNGSSRAKPGLGMAEELFKKIGQRGLSVDLERSFIVGPSVYLSSETRPDGSKGTDWNNYDRKFSENLGISVFHSHDFFEWPSEIRAIMHPTVSDRPAKLKALGVPSGWLMRPTQPMDWSDRPPLPAPPVGANLSFENTIQFLRSSPLVFFVEGRNEIAPGEATFLPGESYTVNLLDQGGIVIGRNIPGDQGIIGGSGSHWTLHYAHRGGQISPSWGGAIRINPDGSIDVAGRHRQKPSFESASKIASLLQQIIPGLQTRKAGGRLSDLP